MINTENIIEQRKKILQAAQWETNLTFIKIDPTLKAFLQYMEHRRRIAKTIIDSHFQSTEDLIPQFDSCNEKIKQIIGI